MYRLTLADVRLQDRWRLLSTIAYESLSLLQQVVLILSAFVSVFLGVYAIHVWMLTVFAIRRRRPPRISSPVVWPFVSIHIPVYNESLVVSRVLDSVLALDYPRDRLKIIVVDDSSDGTTALVQSYQDGHPGLVKVIHRSGRDGFKAGALQISLLETDSELIALFDADQVPPSDFLRRTIPYLCAENKVAFVQGRPSYRHDGHSWVARALSLGMDSFAFVDQEARFSADLLTHFSGGGGVFRRSAILDVGGWRSETLAEDLDISVRLRLSGWRYIYDASIPCPGEAPTSFAILRRQQFRWASGFAGCLKKYWRRLLATRNMSAIQKFEALTYLTGYVASPLIAIGVVLAVLYCAVFPTDFLVNGFRYNPFAALALVMSGLIYTGPLALFAVAVHRSTDGWPRRLRRITDLFYLGVLSVGIFLTSARAVVAGLLDKATYFYRTPKRGRVAQSRANAGVVIE